MVGTVAAVDHIIYGASSLDAGIDAIEALLGVRAKYGGKHVGLGTHNAILEIGDRQYLEIIAPDPSQPMKTPRAFGVTETMTPQMVGWAVATSNIDALVEGARLKNYDAGAIESVERELPDGKMLQWRMSTPPNMASLPFAIEWGGARHPSANAPSGAKLVSMTVGHPDPESVSWIFSALGVEVDFQRSQRPDVKVILEVGERVVELF